jgi:hypothetical protein
MALAKQRIILGLSVDREFQRLPSWLDPIWAMSMATSSLAVAP